MSTSEQVTLEVDTIGSQKGKELTAELRRAESLELYLGGHSFRQVGEKLGVSHQTASKDVHKRLGQLVDADIQEALALRSLQAARYQRLLKAVWNLAVAGDDKAYQQALQVLHKLDTLFGLAKLAEITVNVDARSVNITDSGVAPDGVDYRQNLLDRVQAIVDRREALFVPQAKDMIDVMDNGPRPTFHVVYDDPIPENGNNLPPLLEPRERQQLPESEPGQVNVEEAKPQEEVSRRRDVSNHREDVDDVDDEAPETVAQRQQSNLLRWLAEDDGYDS